MMTKTTFCGGVQLVLLLAANACTDPKSPIVPVVNRETSPALPSPRPVPPSAVPPAFPAVSRPARVFVALHQPVYPMHGSPLASRYLLYQNATFALQYASANYPFFEYRGTYKEADAVITFEWEDCCGWGATGVLRDDAMTVEYSDRMQHSDFLNGVYALAK